MPDSRVSALRRLAIGISRKSGVANRYFEIIVGQSVVGLDVPAPAPGRRACVSSKCASFLLQEVHRIEVSRDKITSMSAEVKQLVGEPVVAEKLEMAAQLLEDSCGDIMKWFLKVP